MTTATSALDLTRLVEGDGSYGDIAGFLDGVDAQRRVDAVRALPGRLQARLWTRCESAPPLTLDDMVPPSVAAGQTVIFAGKNSLPMFTWFEKRFVRQDGAVVGYNFQTMSWFTGPGYFTVIPAADRPTELLFDYTQVPSVAPAGWPAVKPNSAGFSRFVYKGLHDYCRRVARDVVIGKAARLAAGGPGEQPVEKQMDNYFLLART